MKISILILTLNEQSNIKDCINSVSWSDDIVVLDSFSTDSTVEIAESTGARVIQRKFDDWSTHQNWAMKNIKFVYRWVLYIDADERCTSELQNEIVNLTENTIINVAYRVRRKDYFMGSWLKRAQLYPTWLIRLFRPEMMKYERLVNPVAIVDGKIGELQEHLNHYPFSQGIGHWLDRHNKYSDMEAKELMKLREGHAITYKDLLCSDPNARRKTLKNVFYKLPARPFIKFIYYYFLRRGFLDGYPGFSYCVLQSFYEYMITCKVREMIYLKSNKSL